ncbi:MAG: NAD(P)H-dependent oxidoreductase [Bacteroidetes bacterium]|jgi:FMN-dependent NADH-azoreductase|nr:NAD(P)H-dependent oxidoreductase [Bacteroidota bacterium]
MKKILNVISSARGAASNSTQLVNAITEKLTGQYPGSTVKLRDLVEHHYPHLEESHLNAFYAPAETAAPESKEAVRHSNEAIEEVFEADVIVIAVPIYNFNIPSALKAWLDHLVRRGKTFSYGSGYPEGLVKDKKVYLAIASGGVFSDGPMKSYDFAEPYLRMILGFIGITDVTTFRVEGVNMPDLKETALQKGIESIVL